MGINPVGKYVKLKIEKRPEKSEGGIHIPETARNKTLHGEVVAVGSEIIEGKDTRIGCDINVGDTVFYKEHAIGIPIKEDDVDMFFIDPQEIFGVVRKEFECRQYDCGEPIQEVTE